MTFANNKRLPLSRIASVALEWSWLAFLIFALGIADLSTRLLSQYMANVGPIWNANALIAAVAIRSPSSHWPRILGMAAVVLIAGELVMGNSVTDSAVFSLINIAEVLFVASPLRIFRFDREFTHPRSMLAFYLIAIGPGTIGSSLLACTYLGLMYGEPLGESFPIWYASASMGMISVAPIAAVLNFRDFVSVIEWRRLPGTLALMLVMAGTLVVMRSFNQLPLGFLLFPVVLLFTVFRGYPGLAVAVGLGSLATIANLIVSKGYLSMSPILFRDKLIVLQLFLGVLSATSMFCASVLAERRKLIEQLKDASISALAARDTAERANQAKSSFLASMSHELRTPLNAILGYSEIMRDGLLKARCEGECREHSKIVHGAGSHLLSLINDILDMSKIEAGKFDLYLEEVDVCAAVLECAGLMDVRAQQAGLRLHLDVPDSAATLRADGRALRQIILNLLSNAIRFTLPGGSVTVSLENKTDQLKLAVHDTGIGIPAKDLPRLGIPFEQVRRSSDVAHSGTGLGLALVSALARKHGGTMMIESEEGRGTVVTITLPLGDRSARQDVHLAAE